MCRAIASRCASAATAARHSRVTSRRVIAGSIAAVSRWLLPNCKISPSQIVPAAIGVGFLLEILKYVNLLTWPYLRAKLSVEYGPFYYTVTIILWGFLASMVVLAGAEWTARRAQAESAVISR